ncbi:MAG: hydroxymethylbilane synthase [Bacteroidales bacterium]
MRALRLGTRGSQLALWQANTVAERLRAAGAATCEIVVIRTSGDRLAEAPLSEAGGKRLFVKEIEDALANGVVDLAVHSCKDMPVALPDGLAIGACLPREDPRDVLILPPGRHAGEMPAEDLRALLGPHARIGTSSVRRVAELRRFLPDARFEPIRGNLDTRLRKLDRGDHDAIVLAAAGVRRLGFTARISATLPFDLCVPAPGQGAIAIEIRAADQETRHRVHAIDDRETALAVNAERALVARLGGGCQTPVGAIATLQGVHLTLSAVVASLDGSRAVRGRLSGRAEDGEAIGAALADQLAREGAVAILEEVRHAQEPVEGSGP